MPHGERDIHYQRAAINALKSFIRQPCDPATGYRRYLVEEDGQLLCHACAQGNYARILEATRADHLARDEWACTSTLVTNPQDVGDDGSWRCAHCTGHLFANYTEQAEKLDAQLTERLVAMLRMAGFDCEIRLFSNAREIQVDLTPRLGTACVATFLILNAEVYAPDVHPSEEADLLALVNPMLALLKEDAA